MNTLQKTIVPGHKITGIEQDGNKLIVNFEWSPVQAVDYIHVNLTGMKKTSVHHWEFHNGIDPVNPGSQWPSVLPRGWTCWVYPADDQEFEEWMARMCPTAECTHRFNSGNPMYTVSISDDKEATLFQLKWM